MGRTRIWFWGRVTRLGIRRPRRTVRYTSRDRMNVYISTTTKNYVCYCCLFCLRYSSACCCHELFTLAVKWCRPQFNFVHLINPSTWVPPRCLLAGIAGLNIYKYCCGALLREKPSDIEYSPISCHPWSIRLSPWQSLLFYTCSGIFISEGSWLIRYEARSNSWGSWFLHFYTRGDAGLGMHRQVGYPLRTLAVLLIRN